MPSALAWIPARPVLARLCRNWPLLWRSRLLWALCLMPFLTAGAAWVALQQPLSLDALPRGDLPTFPAGLYVTLVMVGVYVWFLLSPRRRLPLAGHGLGVLARSWGLAYLVTLALLPPLVVYDGLFSHRVANLADRSDVQAARHGLEALHHLACDRQPGDAQARDRRLSAIAQEEARLGPILGRLGIVGPQRPVACDGKLQEPVGQWRNGETVNWPALQQGLERAAFESARAEGRFAPAVNSGLRGALFRQTGCLMMVLVIVLLDLAARPAWRQRLARLSSWAPALLHQAGSGLADWRSAWPVRMARRRPGLWAVQPLPFWLLCLAALAIIRIWLWPTDANTSLRQRVLIDGAAMVLIGAVHWARQARRLRLSPDDARVWREYALGVTLAMAVALLLPLAVLPQPKGDLLDALAWNAVLLLITLTLSLLEQASDRSALTWRMALLLLAPWALQLTSPGELLSLLPGLIVLAGLAIIWSPLGQQGDAGAQAWRARVGLALVAWSPLGLLVIGDLLPASSVPALRFLALVTLGVVYFGWLLMPALFAIARHRDRPRPA